MAVRTSKLSLVIAPLGSCAGCDVAIVDIGESVLEIANIADIVFWPTAADGKLEDIANASTVDIAIVHGMIGNSEQEKILRLIEKKARIVVAFGTCAYIGGIFGLRNAINNATEVLREAYLRAASTINPGGVIPSLSPLPSGLEMPRYYDVGKPLNELVDVDIYVPGCPPTEEQILALIDAIKAYAERRTEGEHAPIDALPPKGTVIAGSKTLCSDCPREKPDKIVVKRLIRRYELKEDNGKCFLEQGVFCMGPATRSGCDSRCIRANVPCRGCFGPVENVRDQGAKMLSALASSLYSDEEKTIGETALAEILGSIPDTLGYFYRFSLPSAIINKKVSDHEKSKQDRD